MELGNEEYLKFYCGNGHFLSYIDGLDPEAERPERCEICGCEEILMDHVEPGQEEVVGPMVGFDMFKCPECGGKGDIPKLSHTTEMCECEGLDKLCVSCFGTGTKTIKKEDSLKYEECPLCMGRGKLPVEKFDVNELKRKSFLHIYRI